MAQRSAYGARKTGGILVEAHSEGDSVRMLWLGSESMYISVASRPT